MKVVVIGGGASGVVSAITAKKTNPENEVIILEKNNTLLKKILITGNGRCNYYNETYNKKYYHSKTPELIDCFINSNNLKEALDFFDNLGVIPKIKNGCYYPVTNQAITIKSLLEEEINKLKIEVIYNTEVIDIKKDNNKFIIETKDNKYESDKVILSTGSYSYSKTGSDGFAYSILEKLSHEIIKPVPALVQLESNFKYLKDWDGIRSDVVVELFEDNNYIAKEEGEIQLTKYGVSGICIFNLSHYISRGLLENKKYQIKINFVPFIETLITPWMDNYSKKNKEKNINELLQGFINIKLIPIILKVSKINKDKKYSELTNEEKLILCKTLRSLTIDITNTKGFDNSQVCNGGVKLDEVNINTMESKKVKGLYIIGEILDITGNCGGYNLTECWISGILAGKSIGDKND